MIGPLLEEVEQLRNVMKEHHSHLATSEAATRYALIDRVLRLLGWDVHDADAVIPEFQAGAGTEKRVDYALMQGAKPVAFIEAKRYGAPLQPAELEKINTYCSNKSVRWGILTDGDRWRLLDAKDFDNVPQDRVVLDFAVSAESAIDALKHLVTLFARITGRPSSDLSASAPSAISVPHPKPHAAKPKPVPLQPPDGSLPALADEFVPKSPCSLRLLFPDGQQADATQWKLALGRVMEWLSSRGLLTSAQCPMPDRAGKSRHLVSTGKLHPSGKPFVEPRELPGGLWYESNYDGKECCENAIHALQRCGVDPESVHWAPLA